MERGRHNKWASIHRAPEFKYCWYWATNNTTHKADFRRRYYKLASQRN